MFTTFIGSSAEGRLLAEEIERIIADHPLFDPVPWWHHSVARAGVSFFNSLFEFLQQTTFAVFVATPDDLLLKRGKRSKAIRDNVLFEYGLFAGYLGKQNSILFQIGTSNLPSDLDGVTAIRIDLSVCKSDRERRRKLRQAVNKGLEDLLTTTDDDLESMLYELRDSRSNLKPEALRPLLAAVIRKRIDAYAPVDLPRSDLHKLLEKYRKGAQEVGQAGHTTRVNHFFDLSGIKRDELYQISASYARFAARQLLSGLNEESCATRIALHYKKDLRLLSEVISVLRVRPAMVDLDATANRRIKGRCLRGENAILLHDFTTTGFTPMRCIAELRAREVKTHRIVSFFAREENLDKIMAACSANQMEFHVFCVEKRSGELELRGDQ